MSARRSWLVFLLVTLAVAGGVSNLASSTPDGLDSATLLGCAVTQVDGAEELTGQCIAQGATPHPVAASPLADYSVLGAEGSGGLAGIFGALLTLGVAFAVFRLIARRWSRPISPSGPGS